MLIGWKKFTDEMPETDEYFWVEVTTPAYHDRERNVDMPSKKEVSIGAMYENDNGEYSFTIFMIDQDFDSYTLDGIVTDWEWGEKTILSAWQPITKPDPVGDGV